MYILPNATQFNEACVAPDRSIFAKVEVVDGGTTTVLEGSGLNAPLVSMNWNNIVSSNDGFQIGTACMDEFRMTYRPTTITGSLIGKELHPYIGVEVGGSVTYVPIGIFYVTETSSVSNDTLVEVKAYDGMQKFADPIDFSALGVTFPVKSWDLLEAIAQYKGVELVHVQEIVQLLSSEEYVLYGQDERLLLSSNTGENVKTPVTEPLEGTYRDYIGWVAGLVGGYAHMSRTGELYVKQYLDNGFTIGRDVQYVSGATINYGGAVTYTSVVSGTEENPVYPTRYSGNAVSFTNPFATPQVVDRICKDLIGDNGMTVTPCDIQWRSNPCLDAGDIVTVEDKDGNPLTVYVMEREITVTGGLVENLHCYGETEVVKTLNTSPLVTKMKQISQNIKSAEQSASDVINNTKGVFEFIDNGDGTNSGFTIYDADGHGLLRCTAGGLGISPDGGLTYTNAITKDGIIASRLRVYNSAGMQIMYGGPSAIGESLFYLADSDGDRVFQVYPTSTGAEMRFASSTGSTLLRIFSADTGSALYLNNASGHTLFSVTAGSENGNLALHNPSGSRVLFGVASFRDSNDLEQLTFYTNNRDGNQIFGITTYRTSTSSTSYADEAVVRFTNPFSRKNILTLESSKFSSGNTSTSAVFGQDENGAGTVDINATGSYLEITKRSGSTVYFIKFQMAEIMSTGGNTIEPTITYGYRTDGGGYSSKTMTTKTVSIGGTNRTIFAT